MNPEQIRARIRELLDQRARHEQAIAQTRAAVGAGLPSGAQSAALRAARDAIVRLDADLDEAQAALRDAELDVTRQRNAAGLRRDMGGGARITGEPRTYGERSGQSFFRDAFAAQTMGDAQSAERLNRSQREARDEMQQRAMSTSGYAGLVIPQYLADEAALALRSGRPVANTTAKLPLPEQGMTITVPKSTTGAAVSSQALENSSVLNTDEVWTNIAVPVATIAGQQVVSRQALERGTPGLDQLVFRDLAGAYAAEVERQVIGGSGASGQMLGILNTASIGQATAYGAAVTVAAFLTKVAGAIAATAGAGSGIAAKFIGMHPRRWAWLLSQNDNTGRPLVAPVGGGPTSAAAVARRVHPRAAGRHLERDPDQSRRRVHRGRRDRVRQPAGAAVRGFGDADVPALRPAARRAAVGEPRRLRLHRVHRRPLPRRVHPRRRRGRHRHRRAAGAGVLTGTAGQTQVITAEAQPILAAPSQGRWPPIPAVLPSDVEPCPCTARMQPRG